MKWTAILFFSLFILGSCATHGKGNWSNKDKALARQAVSEVRGDLVQLLGEEKTEAYIDCYLYKVEKHFKDFKTADSDIEGCEKLARDCMNEIGY